MGLTTAAMTAFYMWRMMYMTFYGKSRVAPEVAKHVHESPVSMTGVLGVLAAGSVLAGWLGVPKLWTVFGEGFRTFENWLAPMFATGAGEAVHESSHSASTEWTLMLLSIAVAVAGILVAKYFYVTKPEIPENIASAAPGLYRTLYNKWYLDEIYTLSLHDALPISIEAGDGTGDVLRNFRLGDVEIFRHQDARYRYCNREEHQRPLRRGGVRALVNGLARAR